MQESQPALSSRHWKLLDSLPSNEKVALVCCVGEFGVAVMVVLGATVSTVQLRSAGLGSTFCAMSFARTSNVCGPSARLV